MLDPKLIRSKTKKVAENLAKRDNDFDLGFFLDLEESSRKIQTEIETLRSEKNKLSKGKEIQYDQLQMQNYMRSGTDDTPHSIRKIFQVRFVTSQFEETFQTLAKK